MPSTLTQHPAQVPSEPERNFEENVSEIGTDPNAEFDKDLNPVDYPAKPRPADDDIRQSER
ncbi:MAG: hypothetical protein DMF86_09900 [Acidobacteria bacterium]|nr:MAG: hypothetical protein DMF86_09900 [Acidobacteriota bacterium]